MPRIAACGAPVEVLRVAISAYRPRGGAGPGADRGDEVAVLDEPLDHLAAVVRDHADPVARAGDVPDGSTGGQHRGVGGLPGDVEGALAGRHDHAPRGGGLHLGELAVLLAERPGLVELVGRLE